MRKKIKQIEAVETPVTFAVVALCEDNTIWSICAIPDGSGWTEWEQLPDLLAEEDSEIQS